MLNVLKITPGKDIFLGGAADRITALSLLELALHQGASGVSLHGTLPGTEQVSGEFRLLDAVEWVNQ